MAFISLFYTERDRLQRVVAPYLAIMGTEKMDANGLSAGLREELGA